MPTRSGLSYDPTDPPVSNDKPTAMNPLTEDDFSRLEATMKLALAIQHVALEELLDERITLFKQEADADRINDMAIRQLERGADRNDIIGFLQRQMTPAPAAPMVPSTPTPTLTTSSAILATPTSPTTTVAGHLVFCKAEKMKWPQCPTNLQDFSLVQGWRA